MSSVRPHQVALSNLNLVVSVTSIVLITAVLLAIYQAKIRKNLVIMAFLVTSWFSAWNSTLPLFGRSERYVVHFEFELVPPGKFRTLCLINAICNAYFNVLLPGLATAFGAEVFHYLRRVSHTTSFKSTCASSSECMNDLETLPEGESIALQEGRPSMEDDPDFGAFDVKVELAPSEQNWICGNNMFTSYRRAVLVAPFVTSIIAAVLVIKELDSHDWEQVHVNALVCSCLSIKVRLVINIIAFCHLVPASILNLACLVFYLRIRKDVSWAFSIRPHLPLLVRLAVMSVVTALGAILDGVIEGVEAKNRGPPLRVYYAKQVYVMFFPLFAALVFSDKAILHQFASWLFYPVRVLYYRRSYADDTPPKISGPGIT